MTITLHPTLGVNARLTVCSNCGDDGNELILLGNQNFVMTCQDCGMLHVGKFRDCQRCGSGSLQHRLLEEGEKIPAGLCVKCKALKKRSTKEVRKGGIYGQCLECNAGMVFKRGSQIAKATRKASGIKPPKPVGIEFTKCSEHTVPEDGEG